MMMCIYGSKYSESKSVWDWLNICIYLCLGRLANRTLRIDLLDLCSQWITVHRLLNSIELCLEPPPPPSSSCTWSLPSTFPSPDAFSKCSWITFFLCGLVVLSWRHCHYFLPNVTALLSSLCCCKYVICNAYAPSSGGGDWNFPQYFFAVLYLSHPLTSVQNFTEIVPGEPLHCRRWTQAR